MYLSREINIDNIEVQRVRAELLANIFRAAEKLPLKCNEVFKSHYLDEKSTKIIAGELGISEQTVRNHLSYAIKQLKKVLLPGEFYLFLILYFPLGVF